MIKRAEIESAIDGLPIEEKQELLLFLAERLRAAGGKLPDPRTFSAEKMKQWIDEDEAAMRRFRNDQAA